MGFPGVWMTQSGQLAYRVVPKCACSTIGQILYHLDNGHYFDGDIHDATDGLHKWAFDDSRGAITAAIRSRDVPVFTCVRNPYTRILSSFFDKICGIQRNGKRYRGNLVPSIIQNYGIEVDGDFDQIASFRRFLLYARDTVMFRKPMEPDIHWSSSAGHVSTLLNGGGQYSYIFATENFQSGMQSVLDGVDAAHRPDLGSMPRFNESEAHGPRRAHPVADYFDDLSRHLVLEMYHRDFDLFGYDKDDPGHAAPVREIELDRVHAVLAA